MVQVQSLPRRSISMVSVASPQQAGQPLWAGKVTTPQLWHLLPSSLGSLDGQVNRPSAIGTWSATLAICLPLNEMPARVTVLTD